MAKNALVIGKFYPPHRGHKFLIDAASETNNIVHVIVCHKSDQIPEGNLRKAWLQEIHPNAIIKVIDDIPDKGLNEIRSIHIVSLKDILKKKSDLQLRWFTNKIIHQFFK